MDDIFRMLTSARIVTGDYRGDVIKFIRLAIGKDEKHARKVFGRILSDYPDLCQSIQTHDSVAVANMNTLVQIGSLLPGRPGAKIRREVINVTLRMTGGDLGLEELLEKLCKTNM